MYWPPGQASHFFGDGNAAGCKMMMQNEIIEDFRVLKQAYESLGVEIFSCSDWDTPFRRVMGHLPLESLA
jgi:hypothetical protein